MQYITLIKKNYHLIISIDAEKTLVKIQHPIMRTKAQREQTSTNILNREKLKAPPVSSRMTQGYLLSNFYLI